MSKPIEASIVVVDDEPSIRELLVASLHFAGFEVNTAASGSEAIEVIERLQPDLIVLDVMLPDIDGFTVTRRIRQEGITTPVLMLTALGQASDQVKGLRAGADDGATGENAVVVNCRTADIIVGPIGIVIADALLGEITPAMATAVCQSHAMRVLIPVNHCENYIIGVPDQPIGSLVAAAVQKVKALCTGEGC